MLELVDVEALEERERLTEDDIEILRKNVSIIDRRSWNKRASNIRGMARDINEINDQIMDLIDLLPSLSEAKKKAHLKQIDQKNALKDKISHRIEYQVNIMNKLCIHPPEYCIKRDEHTIRCTFCQKLITLRGDDE